MPIHALLVGEGVQTTMQVLEEGATSLSWPLLRRPRSRGALQNEIIERNFGGIVNDILLIVNDDCIQGIVRILGKSKHC